MWIRPRLDLKPSEYFARQGFITFTDDPVGLRNLEFTGADSMLWGSDYPHDEGSFPHSREVIARTFEGCPTMTGRRSSSAMQPAFMVSAPDPIAGNEGRGGDEVRISGDRFDRIGLRGVRRTRSPGLAHQSDAPESTARPRIPHEARHRR